MFFFFVNWYFILESLWYNKGIERDTGIQMRCTREKDSRRAKQSKPAYTHWYLPPEIPKGKIPLYYYLYSPQRGSQLRMTASFLEKNIRTHWRRICSVQQSFAGMLLAMLRNLAWCRLFLVLLGSSTLQTTVG